MPTFPCRVRPRLSATASLASNESHIELLPCLPFNVFDLSHGGIHQTLAAIDRLCDIARERQQRTYEFA